MQGLFCILHLFFFTIYTDHIKSKVDSIYGRIEKMVSKGTPFDTYRLSNRLLIHSYNPNYGLLSCLNQ